MSEKSQKTNDEELLEQTFQSYDAEMTVETNAETEDGNKAGAGNTPPKNKISNNMLIFGGVGIAALVIVGTKFMGGSHPQPVVAPPPPIVAPQPEPVPQPVPEPTPVQPQPQVDQSPAAEYLGNANPLEPKAGNTETPVVAVVPVPVPTQQEVVTPVKVTEPKIDVNHNTNVIAGNASQTGVTNELKSLFDKQTQEIKGALESVGVRVGKVEDAINKQELTNKTIEERLTRLETGKTTNVVSSDSNKVAVKHKYVKKHIKPKVIKVEPSNSVLVDKSKLSGNTNIKVDSPIYPSLDIHSIYGGRVWTKNKDGSLSTYSIGEKLPGGEVIKSIDDEKYKIVTDKRTISK